MLLQLLFVAGLALVPFLAGKFDYLDARPRSRWLSFAGGVSVAYVFVHIFPELQQAQETLGDHGLLGFMEHHAYLVALAGLATFYGLERMAKQRRPTSHDPGGEPPAGKEIFWLHIGAFGLYNALIGYLIVHREVGFQEMLFFVLAMGFHFFVNDHGLSQHHRREYRGKGRWVLSAAVLTGWGVGRSAQLGDALTSVFFAFLAGGLVLNVLKEELPEERQSRFLPFIGGSAVCSALLLMM